MGSRCIQAVAGRDHSINIGRKRYACAVANGWWQIDLLPGAGHVQGRNLFGNKPTDCADERPGGKPKAAQHYGIIHLQWNELF